MNLYRFHWRDGTRNEGYGTDAADAFTKLGFGQGAVPALDYWEALVGERAGETGRLEEFEL